MPRRNLVKDKRTVYIAYRYGIDANGNEVFGDPIEESAIVSLTSGSSPDGKYGTEHDYSYEILFDKNERTKYINLYTRIWVNKIPFSSTDSPDCIISKDPETSDGQILVSCETSAVNESEFYYEFGGKVLSFVARDDLENNRFYTPANMYLPIDNETKMWYLEPVDSNDTENTMRLDKKVENKNFIEYVVEIDV